MNVFCAISKKAVYKSIFFEIETVNGDTYVNMQENWLMESLSEEECNDGVENMFL